MSVEWAIGDERGWVALGCGGLRHPEAMGENDLTVLLNAWTQGDRAVLDRLAAAIYPDLRRIASACLRNRAPGGTLQPTSLVSELFVKLMRDPPGQFENRRRFYGFAARMMRLALVDHYREQTAQKRIGSRERVPFHEEISWVDATGPELLDFDQALDELAELDALQAELLQLRFVVGCTSEETARLTGLSKATVDRKVRLGRAWLFRRLGLQDEPSPGQEPIS